jgi:Carbohydrate-selective porin, OprB family
MLKFLSQWGKPVPFGYMVSAILLWLCLGTDVVKADIQPDPTLVKAPISIDGEIVLGITSYGGVIPTANRSGSNTMTSDRLRLNIQTTLTGRDRLKIQVQSGNNTPLNASITGTNMTRSGYDTVKGSSTNLSLLRYTLPIDAQTKLTAEVTGCTFSDNLTNFNPLLSSSGSGATSRFGRYNPIYRLSTDGTGIILDRQLSPALNLAIGYSIPSITAINATPVSASIVQLSYHPNPYLDLGLTYAHSDHPNGSGVSSSTGSASANAPFGSMKTSANHYSLAASYKLSPRMILAGWVGLTAASQENDRGGNASIGNYALTLTFLDVGKPGSMLGVIIGMPPKLLDRSTGIADRSTSLHLEALYKIQVNPNLDITSSILIVTNPEHNSNNSTIYVGSVRTTLRF